MLCESLDHDLRWRDPVGYERMHRQICHYALDRLLRDAQDPRACMAVMRTIGHLRRRGGIVHRYISRGDGEDLRASRANPADHDELVALTRETHGEVTAASVRFWLGRQPEAFSLLRCRRSDRLRAFTSRLTLRAPEREELENDPVIAEIWHDVGRRMSVPPAAHIAIARHLVGPDFKDLATGPSPVTDVFLARMLHSWLHEPATAASYLVVTDGRWWRPLMEHMGQYEVACAGHPDAIFGHDWLADPPKVWRDRHLDEELWAERHPILFDCATQSHLSNW
ncbi:hypothetical protein GCM10010404_92270 [Nonomuraea africana]|uniref:Uncharacterized protein n=1 Tax=Nonomuraea africana TaxID=46171 RepID=A0ABR9K6M2_9ACTN|nr:hypothetical protein [Nonomuraea africana]MBE1557663.1 hypothetical protein [Nonomuraea africana]